MKIVVQRVKRASVTVSGNVVGSIGPGLCLLVGLGHEDTEVQLEELASKVCRLKLFSASEEDGRWRNSVAEPPQGQKLSILAVSQFTLYARTDKGAKPDFHEAMPGTAARVLFDRFVQILKDKIGSDQVQTGAFGQFMQVEIINDGPVTILLESKKKSTPL